MDEWESVDINVNDIKLHYYRTGGKKPPLILSHGFSDNGLCWTPVARVLQKQYDVIMVDTRGHGLSDSPSTEYGMESMAADLADLIRKLDLKKPMLMGHSMGAQISILTSVLYPELVKAVILEDPAFLKNSFPKKLMIKYYIHEFKKNSQKTEEDYVVQCKKENSSWASAEIKAWALAHLQFFKRNPENILKSMDMKSTWEELFENLKCPILLITSEHGIMRKKMAKKASQLWKKGLWVLIEDAGHNIRRENFKKYMKTVTDFLHKYYPSE